MTRRCGSNRTGWGSSRGSRPPVRGDARTYGARIAVIAGFSCPEGADRSMFLFDIDACGVIEIVHAGVFDDVRQAATAWRALVGDTADSATTLRFCVVDCGACLDGGKYRLRAIHQGKSRHGEAGQGRRRRWDRIVSWPS
jgi:hypothetical protein